MLMNSHLPSPQQSHNITGKKLITVIIVDDYKLSRMGVSALLKAYPNIRIIGEAETAEKGLFLIRQLRPNVVLMDLGLPGMNGIEATHKIKALDDKTKVVFLTSHEREEEVMAAFSAGANAYCLKDIEGDDLALAIEAVSEGSAWIDPKLASIALRAFPSTKDVKPASPKKEYENYARLTDREMEVLHLIVEGKSNTEIAAELIVSVHTAKAHVCSILQKLFVSDRVQAAVKAVKEGIV